MDTQKIARQFRLSEWSKAVKERIASGQSVDAFCEAKSISKATYYYRQKKVREAACAELAATQSGENTIVPAGWTQLAEVESVTAGDSVRRKTRVSLLWMHGYEKIHKRVDDACAAQFFP